MPVLYEIVAAGLSSRDDHPPLLFLGMCNNHGGHPVCWASCSLDMLTCAPELYICTWWMSVSPRALNISCCFWLDGPALSATGRDGGILVRGWIYVGIVGNMLYCQYVNSMFDVGVLSTRVQSWLVTRLLWANDFTFPNSSFLTKYNTCISGCCLDQFKVSAI